MNDIANVLVDDWLVFVGHTFIDYAPDEETARRMVHERGIDTACESTHETIVIVRVAERKVLSP